MYSYLLPYPVWELYKIQNFSHWHCGVSGNNLPVEHAGDSRDPNLSPIRCRHYSLKRLRVMSTTESYFRLSVVSLKV